MTIYLVSEGQQLSAQTARLGRGQHAEVGEHQQVLEDLSANIGELHLKLTLRRSAGLEEAAVHGRKDGRLGGEEHTGGDGNSLFADDHDEVGQWLLLFSSWSACHFVVGERRSNAVNTLLVTIVVDVCFLSSSVDSRVQGPDISAKWYFSAKLFSHRPSDIFAKTHSWSLQELLWFIHTTLFLYKSASNLIPFLWTLLNTFYWLLSRQW